MSKMTNCKICDKEIAKSAKVCPYCGAKNKAAIYKRPWFIVLVLILVIGVVGLGGGSDDADTGGAPAASNEAKQDVEYIEYHVSQLVNDLEENAMKAAELYNGQYVSLTGDLGTIDSNGSYICVYPAGDIFPLYNVMCYIQNEEQKKVIMDMSQGDSIIVKGKITDVGEVVGYYLDIDEVKAN